MKRLSSKTYNKKMTQTKPKYKSKKDLNATPYVQIIVQKAKKKICLIDNLSKYSARE
jgi:hypothetical protein